jgi:tRNA(Ile)-lysidine synthase
MTLPASDGRMCAGELTLYRGNLRWRSGGVVGAPGREPAAETRLSIAAPGLVTLPEWGGALQVLTCEPGQWGVPLRLLAQATLKRRSGGEQFQMASGRPARSLKKQFQAQAVPAWDRQAPLLWAGDALVFVPGLGVDARVAMQADDLACVRLCWLAQDGANCDTPTN